MSSESPAADAHVRRFWAEYDALLKAYRVPAKAIPWYRRRVEGYIEAPPDRRLRDHTPDDLETSLNDMGRDARLSDSQFRQIVDALRLLFQKVLAVPWSAQFDWRRWSDGSKELGVDHRTVARTCEKTRALGGKAKKAPGLAARHPEIYGRFLAAARIPDYSISTERSYLGWIDRFLLRHSDHPLESLGEAHVRSCLEDLAVMRKVAGATQGQAPQPSARSSRPCHSRMITIRSGSTL